MKRTLVLVASTIALMGCSATSDPQASPTALSPSVMSSAGETTMATEPDTLQDLYEVSAAGLTTAVNVPVTLTDEELAAGCAEAKAFSASIGRDPEFMLGLMQATAEDSTEGLMIIESRGESQWANLTPEVQANRIAMIDAATAGEC